MDLPSVLGGAVQGFKDFGKSALDLFGGGGANILDIIESLQTGKLTSRRQDDFRKWLYDTDDSQDAAAKGLGTALNGIQTISDYIPGLNAVSQNPLFNATQGALGGIADEFKMYGKDADLGRAGQRALVSGGAALASSGLGNYIGSSASPLATSNTLKGAARGALGGAINQGGYTAIEGGNLSDILSSAGQGASMGGLIGGATGVIQDFKPAKTYDAPLTDDEKTALIANAKNMLAKERRPERIAELNAQIERLGGNDPQTMEAIDAILSPEQREFFKDSVIRDENGNLKKMYHGSPDGTFTKFKEGSFFTDDKDYADVYQDEYAGMNYAGKKSLNPKTYEVYLDVKKPFSMADPEARRIIENEYVGRDKNYWVTNPSDTTEVDFTEADNLRAWLKKNHPEYDGMYVNEGGGDDPFAEEGWEEWRGNSVVPFSPNQIKDVNNLKPTSSADIMEELIPDANNDPETMRAIDNILSIDNELIQDIKPMDKTARAQQIIDNNADIFKAPVKNALYDKIDPKTLPAGYEKLIDYLDTQNGPNSVMERRAKEYFGTPYIDEVSTDKLLDYVWGNDNLEKKVYKKSLDEAIERNRRTAKSLGLDPDKAVEDAIKSKEQDLRWRTIKKLNQEIQDEIRQESGSSSDITYALLDPNHRSVRAGYAGALDTALSERLGIAPGNTIKDNIYFDDLSNRSRALGHYDGRSKDIAINEKGVPETIRTVDGFLAKTDPNDSVEARLSTMAHERLHSFQNEARPENIGRYSKEVTDAYAELSKDLKPFLKKEKDMIERYGDKKPKYWAAQQEQESRMLQTYLENKGIITDALQGKRKDEWGNEINPAFDKFFDKLRKLSKKGVALPAITALLGGGAYMASQENNKDKEIK